jgi:drug/metabolite transporter (DMT)-like permease
MTAAFALLASLVWGSSDFVGGLVSRRVRPLVVVGVAHAIALATLVVIAAASGAFAASTDYLPWALAAGFVGFIGLVVFYRALATGVIGVVAPIAGAGAVVPVAAGLAGGDAPSGIQLAGIALAVAGVALASGPELSGKAGRTPVLLAMVAALCFGAVYVLLDRAAETSVLMSLVAMRIVSVAIASCLAIGAIARGRRAVLAAEMPVGRNLAMVAVVGWTDAAANGFYGLATRGGLVSVVSVLASLYPAVTVLLARVLQDERMRRIQAIGVTSALAGVVLLAAG